MPTGLTFERICAQSALRDRAGELSTLYQRAFAAAPWNERSKCALGERNANCPDGFSALAVGAVCTACQLEVTEEAYTEEELSAKFNRPDTAEMYTTWFIEETGFGQIVLAALTRITDFKGLRDQIYANNPAMQEWLEANFIRKDVPVAFIEDIFADTDLRNSGNLARFGAMCHSLVSGLGTEATVALRTLNPKVVSAANRDFRSKIQIFDPAFNQIPDRGRFIVIDVK